MSNELIEAAQQADDMQAGEIVAISNEVPEDYLVACNSCGHVQRKSEPGGCPDGHEAGWSYAGPLEEQVESEFVDPVAQQIAEAEREFAERPEEPEADIGVDMTEGLFGSSVPDAAEEPAKDEGPSPEELARDMDSIAVEKAIMHMFDVQDRLESAIDDHAEKADVAKTAKKRVESLQEDLSVAVRAVREARASHEPDPARYPLLDRPKEPTAKDEINATFAKPEAIQPLPADTPEEFYRRKKRDARFADLGLKPKIVEILEGAGYHTVLDLDKLHEAQADITTIRCQAGTITEKRGEEIRDALGVVATRWVEEWQAAHPESNSGTEESA